MQKLAFLKSFILSAAISSFLILTGCQPQATNTGANLVNTNTNANIANSFVNASNTNVSNTNSNATSVVIETREPEQYEAKVALRAEALGDTQKANFPPLTATVARNGTERRMEFVLPGNNERVIYLDKAGTNYLILPNRKQYAELNRESLGFEVRRMLLPEQIVQQVKNLKGLQMVGEEQLNGRTVTKYKYEAVANTQTQAGQVETESFLIVDKETGLPLRSETVVQSQSGGNVQGFKGLRLVTEMSDIKTTADAAAFSLPPEYTKVEAEQVKAQVNLIFGVAMQLFGQMMNQQRPTASPAAVLTPTPQG
ncbi:MAG TPA: hypothetical protein VF556_17250 [Pyrinomonadaceae bacterium]|jgi:hypothetical protein